MQTKAIFTQIDPLNSLPPTLSQVLKGDTQSSSQKGRGDPALSGTECHPSLRQAGWEEDTVLSLCKHCQKCHQDHKRKGPGQREQSPLLGAQLLRETKETLTASAAPCSRVLQGPTALWGHLALPSCRASASQKARGGPEAPGVLWAAQGQGQA